MSNSFLPTWLYNDQKIFELELDKYSKNYWHPLIFIGEIKPGEILEKKFFNQSLLISRSENNLITVFKKLPPLIEDLLEQHNKSSEKLAHDFFNIKDVIFLGRGINYPIALEGALKLKEISYIHAAGYPAGEMKHGPIALLDKKVPVISIASPGEVFDKVISNAQEAKARDSYLIGIAPECNGTEIFDYLMKVPSSNEWISPLLNILPLQLLSYHIASHRGLAVDHPRNLAKSVTVE